MSGTSLLSYKGASSYCGCVQPGAASCSVQRRTEGSLQPVHTASVDRACCSRCSLQALVQLTAITADRS